MCVLPSIIKGKIIALGYVSWNGKKESWASQVTVQYKMEHFGPGSVLQLLQWSEEWDSRPQKRRRQWYTTSPARTATRCTLIEDKNGRRHKQAVRKGDKRMGLIVMHTSSHYIPPQHWRWHGVRREGRVLQRVGSGGRHWSLCDQMWVCSRGKGENVMKGWKDMKWVRCQRKGSDRDGVIPHQPDLLLFPLDDNACWISMNADGCRMGTSRYTNTHVSVRAYTHARTHAHTCARRYTHTWTSTHTFVHMIKKAKCW